MNPLIIFYICQVIYEANERETVFNKAKAKSMNSGKPLLNAGCGELRAIGGFPRAIYESDVNLDVVPRAVPRFTMASIEDIPYSDKHFGSVFCCHALEHVDNLDSALSELHRVADEVFIIVPKPVWMTTWVWPGHRRVFIGDKVVELR